MMGLGFGVRQAVWVSAARLAPSAPDRQPRRELRAIRQATLPSRRRVAVLRRGSKLRVRNAHSMLVFAKYVTAAGPRMIVRLPMKE